MRALNDEYRRTYESHDGDYVDELRSQDSMNASRTSKRMRSQFMRPTTQI